MFSKTPVRLLGLTLLAIAFSGCSEEPSTNIDAESTLAALGGAILSTQSDGRLAQFTPAPTFPEKIWKWIEPVPEAFAVTTCPTVTTGTCSGTQLTVFYDNCQPTGLGNAGYWRSYITYDFPTAGDCTNVQTAGFDAAALAGLTGQTVTRTWGVGANGDQYNIRLGANWEAVYVYSDFPSGWKEDRQGGISITFETTSQRRIVINGIHAFGISHTEAPVADPDNFDLTTLNTVTDGTTSTKWDHTINTVKTGDALFELGPELRQNIDGTYTWGDLENNTVAGFDGDLVVAGTTVQRGGTFRVQHNMSESVGVAVVTQPLAYTDPLCCWPMSGQLSVQYDQNLKAPTVEEVITFTGSSCGQISYTTSAVEDEIKTLNHCF